MPYMNVRCPCNRPQVSEAMLKAFGVEVCGDLIAKRGLLAALFSEVSTDFFMEAVRLGLLLLLPYTPGCPAISARSVRLPRLWTLNEEAVRKSGTDMILCPFRHSLNDRTCPCTCEHVQTSCF